MLLIGCAKAKQIAELIDGQTFEGITFRVESLEGMMLRVSSSADDNTAKRVIRAALKGNPAVGMAYMNIQLVDANGTIL